MGIIEDLVEIANQMASQRVTIVARPEDETRVRALVASRHSQRFTVISSPHVPEGQVLLCNSEAITPHGPIRVPIKETAMQPIPYTPTDPRRETR